MKTSIFKKVILVIGVLAVVFAAAGIISTVILKNGGKVILPWASESDKKVDLVQVKSSYYEKAGEIVQNYLAQDAKIKDNEFGAKAANAELAIEELLKLTLTKEEKTVQLDLVLALSDAERGWQLKGQGMEKEGQNLLDKSQEKLDELMLENEWLK
jgi:flagellar basal body-associated protein FliL